jgi:polar amino acid transport system substrate-binding protein
LSARRGALAWALATAVAVAGSARASGLERVRRQGELRWAGDLQGGEPYVFRDPRDPSRLLGFELELARALAARLGVGERFVQNDWHNLLPSLERGDFDVALNGLEDSPALHTRALATQPYLRFTEQLAVRKGSQLRSLAALRGHRVGTLASSLAHQILRAQPGIEVVLYEGVDEPFLDLELGRLDAVLLDSVISERYGPRHPGVEIADAAVASGSYVIGVRRGEEDLLHALDQALAQVRASGELAAILRRWQLGDPASGPAAATAVTAPLAPARLDQGQLALFLRGGAVTLLVSLLAMALAAPIGLALALARLHGGRGFRFAAHAYVELFRGTPLLLQLYLLYYGLAPLIHLDALAAAVLGLGLNYGAYEAEVQRAALGSVPIGQAEAAAALGLSRAQALRLVLVPQALRTALPAMTNDLIALLKDSSLVSVITVVELTKQMTITAVDVRSWALPGVACAALYFAMSYPLARLAARLERRLGEHPEAPVGPAAASRETGAGSSAAATDPLVAAADSTVGATAGMAASTARRNETVIRVRGLAKSHGTRVVLWGIDAEVRRGETIALVGPSGGGKSTLLRCLNGLESFDAGSIEVAGLSLGPGTPDDARLLLALRSRVGMVFQGFHLFPHLTALENVCLAPLHARGEPRTTALARGRALLARVGLADRAGAQPGQLSGGQQQRVAIARALATRPEVVLLDEPTSALDPQMRGEVLEVLRDLAREGHTMLVVTHEMGFARAAASRVWVFDEGRLVEEGPPSEVCDRPRSERARSFFGAPR